MAIKPYLQLVRLPNLFTAAADSLTGWLLVERSLNSTGEWLPLVAASVAIYAGGVVLNDVFDRKIDQVERPNRPLPSGRVSTRVAAIMGVALMGGGLALTAVSGAINGLTIGGALVWCVLAYDAILKRSIFGPLAMGTCRWLNLLLGMSASHQMTLPAAFWLAAFYGMFVAGVTWISRSEAGERRRLPIAIGAGFQIVGLLGWLFFCLLRGPAVDDLFFFELPRSPDEALGLFVVIAIGCLLAARDIAALRRPEPAVVQRTVVTGIRSLIWLHVALLLSQCGFTEAALVGWLWFPAILAGRWVYST